MINRNSIFPNGEGDAWYQRKQEHLSALNMAQEPDVTYILLSLSPCKNRIENLLEIGCSHGFELKKICEVLDAKGVGIDPSEKAVSDGNAMKHNAITLVEGTGNSLPFAEEHFDPVTVPQRAYSNFPDVFSHKKNDADLYAASGISYWTEKNLFHAVCPYSITSQMNVCQRKFSLKRKNRRAIKGRI